jgi:hypothetical protein
MPGVDLTAWLDARPWIARAAVVAVLVGLVGWSAWNRWLYLSSTPFPIGVDGYFYAVQLRSIIEHGHLQYPASPLTFWLLAPFAWLTDPITGAKLGASILGALVAVPAYGVGRRVGGSRVTGLLAAAMATPSAGSFYLTLEFVKNGVGLTVVLTYVWLLLRAVERPSAGRIAAAAVALIAAFLTHKMAAGLAVMLTLPAVATELRAHTGARWLRWIAIVAIAAAVLTSVLLVLAWAFPGRALGGHEVGLLRGLFTGRARWMDPALDAGKRPLWIGHEALIAGVLGVAVLVVFLVRRTAAPARAPAMAVVLTLARLSIVIALPYLDVHDPQGLGFRMRVAAFVPRAVLAAALAGQLGALLPRDVRVAAVAAFALVWAIAQPRQRDEGAVPTHPALATATAALAGTIPDGAVVICPERHIVFMVAWYTRADVRLRPEAVPPERRWRLLPLAFIGDGSPLDAALMRARGEPGLVGPIGVHPRHPNGLVLVPEATWDWVLEQLPPDRQKRLRRWRTI